MAGTVKVLHKRRGKLNGVYKSITVIPVVFTADSNDASFIPYVKDDMTGYLAGVHVVFGTPAPNNINIVVATMDGVDLLGGDGAGFTSTGKVTLSPPELFVQQLNVYLSGNTVNSASVKVLLNVF